MPRIRYDGQVIQWEVHAKFRDYGYMEVIAADDLTTAEVADNFAVTSQRIEATARARRIRRLTA